MGKVLGYDCDGVEIEEFRVLRYPFSSDIENWEEEPNIDPRFYCALENDKGIALAISVYDDYHSKYIRRFEGIDSDKPIPTIIKSIEEMEGYEVAFDGLTKHEWFYDRDEKEILEIANNYSKKVKIK